MNHPRTLIMLLLSSIVVCSSCQRARTFNDLNEFERFVSGNESPFLQTITENHVIVSVRYMPEDLIMLNYYRQHLEQKQKVLQQSDLTSEERRARLDTLRKNLDEQRQQFRRSVYFQLTIAYEDPGRDVVYEKMKQGQEAYSEWLSKLMFGLKDKITLHSPVTGAIPLDVYHMERTFGLQKNASFILMFPAQFNNHELTDPKNEWLRLRVEEFGMRTGVLTFEFKMPFPEVKYQGDL